MAAQSNTIAQLLSQKEGGVIDPGQLQQSVKLGMDLATAKDKIESEKMDLAAKKEQAAQAKFDMLHKGLITLTRTSPQVAKRLVPQLQKKFDAAGIAYDPIVLEQIASDDSHRNKIKAMNNAGLFEGMRGDAASREEAFASVADVVGWDKAMEFAEGMLKQKMTTDAAERTAVRQAKTQEKQGRSEVMQLRKEYQSRPEVKNFIAVSEGYNKMQEASKKKSAAGDMSLIFGYMKMLDPGSTVREGEFANAQNTAGIPDRVRNAYNKAKDGEFLSDNQRKDFMAQAGSLFSAQEKLKSEVDTAYSEMSNRFGYDPGLVVAGVSKGGNQAAKSGSQQPADPKQQLLNAIKASKYATADIIKMAASKGIKLTEQEVNAARGK